MPVGEKMQLTTLCKLGLVTSADQADLDQKSNAVTIAATNLQNKIDDLVKNDMSLVKKLGNHVNKLQKDLKQYTSINKKIGKNENTIEGLSGFSTDTELNMISNNYRYKNCITRVWMCIYSNIQIDYGGDFTQFIPISLEELIYNEE